MPENPSRGVNWGNLDALKRNYYHAFSELRLAKFTILTRSALLHPLLHKK